MDRQAVARAQRRITVSEALEFERERAVALRERLESIVTELEGPAIDESIFAGMTPEDVEVVRPTVQVLEPEPVEDEWLDPDSAPADPAVFLAEQEQEIARLEGEIAASSARQAAFARYLEALGD